MNTGVELIDAFKNLPQKEQQVVVDFVMSEASFTLEEDNDVALEEDIAELDAIRAEESSRGDAPTSQTEMMRRIHERLRNE